MTMQAGSAIRTGPGYRPEEFALRKAAWHIDKVTFAGDSRGLLSKGLFNGLENWEWNGPVPGSPPTGYRFRSDRLLEQARQESPDQVG